MAAYREGARPCALCRSPMREVGVDAVGGGSTVDVCDACGAVFLEYFDGEPAALSRALRVSPRPVGDVDSGNLPRRCPDCEVELELLRYLDEGPHVYRCGGCMAVVATRAQLQALRQFRLQPEIEDDDSFLAKLLRLVGV